MDHHNSFKEVVWETKNGLSSEYFGLVTAHLTELLPETTPASMRYGWMFR